MAKSQVVSLRLSKVEIEALDLLAKHNNITRSELIRKIIRGYLKYKGLIV